MGKLFTSKLFKGIPHIFRVSESKSPSGYEAANTLHLFTYLFVYVIEAMFLAVLEVGEA